MLLIDHPPTRVCVCCVVLIRTCILAADCSLKIVLCVVELSVPSMSKFFSSHLGCLKSYTSKNIILFSDW